MSGVLSAKRSGGAALCPSCGKKLCELAPGSEARGVTLWCKRCKAPVELNI